MTERTMACERVFDGKLLKVYADTVRLPDGLAVDLRLVTPAQFPFALHYFTGIVAHNVRVRARALERQHGAHMLGHRRSRRRFHRLRVAAARARARGARAGTRRAG